MNEIQSLREQMRSDFEWTAKALAHQRDVVGGALGALQAALQEGFRQVDRALEAQQQTVEELATRVDRSLSRFASVVEGQGTMLEDHEARLRRLEQDRPPAA